MNDKEIVEDVWVLPGGGNHASYSCGSCKAAYDLGIPAPKVIVASSGGAANAFFYSAGQIDSACDIWGNEISSTKILSLQRPWKVFNRDEMIDGVFMGRKEKLNLEAVRGSPIKIYVGVTNYDTGVLEFFTNRDQINLCDLLKATMTVPMFSGILGDQSMKINKSRYIDSRISSRPELLIKKALSLNPKRVVVFSGVPITAKYRYGGKFWYSAWLLGRTLKTFSNSFRKNQLSAIKQQKDFKLENDRILVLAPGKKIDLPPWLNPKEDLQACVRQGYEDTTARGDELKKFYGLSTP